MASVKYEAGSIQTLASTELNSLANGSSALGAEYDNATNLYMWGLFEINVTWGTNPTAGALVNLYLIPAPDGTNYDDGSGSVAPPVTAYIGGFPVRAVTSAQKVQLGGPGVPALVPLPPTKFKAVVTNNSGQAFPASGSTLKMVPYRLQVV